MTLLGKEEIDTLMSSEQELEQRLVITPLLDPAQIGPASIDVRLGTEFLLLQRTDGAGLDPTNPQAQLEGMHQRIHVPLGDAMWLHPRHFVLAATFEYIRLPPSVGAYVIGRSSWGRVGLIVATAVMAHPGFTGCLTLELVNEGDSPIRLWPGCPIAQLALHRLGEPTDFPYGTGRTSYQAPIGPQVSRLSGDRENIQAIGKLANVLGDRFN